MVRQVTVPTRTRAPDGRTHAYVLADALLVDPAALTDDLAATLRAVEPEHVAVTHHHSDHVGGVAACAEAFDLTVWSRAGRERAFAEAAGLDPDRSYRTGTTLPIGGGIGVVDTPGHAPEHVAFASDGGLATGDLAVADGSVVVGAPDGDMRAYLTSLRRVYARAPERLYPAHGSTIPDPRATCRRLLAHRRRRERRVLAAVEGGARTPEAILQAAYGTDLSGVYDLARATVLAHLEKLAVENRVRWDGDRARPV